jgi:hypothetical protein
LIKPDATSTIGSTKGVTSRGHLSNSLAIVCSHRLSPICAVKDKFKKLEEEKLA